MIYDFYDLERIALASGITSYSSSYSYGKRLSVDDDQIIMSTSFGDSKALRITDIEGICLGQDFFSSQVRCEIHGCDGQIKISFADHSYKKGSKCLAEVKRPEFQAFIENVHKKIVKNGCEESVVFEFSGPSSATVEFFEMVISFFLVPVLFAFGLSFFQELRSLNGVFQVLLIILMMFPAMVLGWYLGHVFVRRFSPNGRYNPREFPEYVFDMANAEITNHCNRILKKKREKENEVW
ncbi:hypothetical protein ABIE59_003940 [Marinobacter sp. MBR-99]|jgi:hypothetical protein|uniref:hypothetical protein n=1 Tax=Marinobacter sp. MBR-99 TaxID=3156461 RepID=UPI0033943A3B